MTNNSSATMSIGDGVAARWTGTLAKFNCQTKPRNQVALSRGPWSFKRRTFFLPELPHQATTAYSTVRLHLVRTASCREITSWSGV